MLQHCPQDFCRLRLFVALLSLERRFTRDEYQWGGRVQSKKGVPGFSLTRPETNHLGAGASFPPWSKSGSLMRRGLPTAPSNDATCSTSVRRAATCSRSTRPTRSSSAHGGITSSGCPRCCGPWASSSTGRCTSRRSRPSCPSWSSYKVTVENGMHRGGGAHQGAGGGGRGAYGFSPYGFNPYGFTPLLD